MREVKRSESLFEEAKTLFPGGVNSPVRAFRSVGGTPVFITKGDGCRVEDADGNQFIDFCCSWGPLILGHNDARVRTSIEEALAHGTSFGTPTLQENELGRLILDNHAYLEKIRFVSSGTEATMSALRLARGYTGRDRIIKFDGCYHGHSDGLLVKAGSGLATFGTSSSAGVPEAYAQQTIVLPLNDEGALEQAFEQHKDQIAAVIIEPIPANNGLLLQDTGFLQKLREVCTAHGTMLIFDEVISGFRVGFEGASRHYDIQPDILTFGKIIGGGLPVGAYGASSEIMASISPDGDVYQAGTLSGNPVAMAAGKAQLSACLEPGFYEAMDSKTAAFVANINTHAKEQGHAFHMFHVGSIFWLAFTSANAVKSAAEIDPGSMNHFNKLYHFLLDNGVYLGPSGYEVGFVSRAHSEADLEEAASIFKRGLDMVFNG